MAVSGELANSNRIDVCAGGAGRAVPLFTHAELGHQFEMIVHIVKQTSGCAFGFKIADVGIAEGSGSMLIWDGLETALLYSDRTG